jgi:hypothetical protein
MMTDSQMAMKCLVGESFQRFKANGAALAGATLVWTVLCAGAAFSNYGVIHDTTGATWAAGLMLCVGLPAQLWFTTNLLRLSIRVARGYKVRIREFLEFHPKLMASTSLTLRPLAATVLPLMAAPLVLVLHGGSWRLPPEVEWICGALALAGVWSACNAMFAPYLAADGQRPFGYWRSYQLIRGYRLKFLAMVLVPLWLGAVFPFGVWLATPFAVLAAAILYVHCSAQRPQYARP